MRGRPKLEDLIAVKLCEPWPGYVDEEAVLAALELGDATAITDALHVAAAGTRDGLRAMLNAYLTPLRRALIFCIDKSVLGPLVLESRLAGIGLPPLPPLPAKWIAIQTTDNSALHSMERDGAEALRGVVSSEPQVVIVMLAEIEQGSRWRAWTFGYAKNDDRYTPAISGGLEITNEVSVGILGRQGGMVAPHDREIPDSVRVCVEAAHLITARGVTLDLIRPENRSERRRLERRGLSVTPKLYWVDVKAGQERAVSGGLAREYHCRWLVRGHWRRIDDARRTWIKAHIKGPAGAPWRGRPVYRVPA